MSVYRAVVGSFGRCRTYRVSQWVLSSTGGGPIDVQSNTVLLIYPTNRRLASVASVVRLEVGQLRILLWPQRYLVTSAEKRMCAHRNPGIAGLQEQSARWLQARLQHLASRYPASYAAAADVATGWCGRTMTHALRNTLIAKPLLSCRC
jgi:hypothetical protein